MNPLDIVALFATVFAIGMGRFVLGVLTTSGEAAQAAFPKPARVAVAVAAKAPAATVTRRVRAATSGT